ncbi:MAG: tRNA pseudouridine(38-40) synthase TruA [Candidatus Zixiibacteriota bacterium]
MSIRNIKLVLEYDGSDFSGWQIQPDQRTVQGVIKEVLNKILKEEINLIGAGRTDVGAHALAQVANFKTETQLDLKAIFEETNNLLPEDILIKEIQEMEMDFHARYSAKSKMYRYRIYLKRTALLKRYVWEVLLSIDTDKMEEALRAIWGKNDFSSFCVAKSAKEDNICNVIYARWIRRNEALVFEIEADRFLHSMVRSLVGTLVDVGRGYFSPSDFTDIIHAKDRKKAGLTAPAKGLYLVKVNY